MSYDRFVHIIRRDDKIKCVLTSKSKARKLLEKMRENFMPSCTTAAEFGDYQKRCAEEHAKWRVEHWPLNKTMST